VRITEESSAEDERERESTSAAFLCSSVFGSDGLCNAGRGQSSVTAEESRHDEKHHSADLCQSSSPKVTS